MRRHGNISIFFVGKKSKRIWYVLHIVLKLAHCCCGMCSAKNIRKKEIAIISNENPIQHKSYIPPITYGNNWQKSLLSRGRCGYRYKSVAVEYFHHFGFCSVRFSDFQYALLGFPVTKKQLFLNFFNKKSH